MADMRKVAKKLFKEANAYTFNEMAKKCFKKSADKIYTYDFNADTLGYVAFNTVAYRGERIGASPIISINPILGVRNHRLEKLVAELSNEKYSQYTPVSLFSSIGYLMPQNDFLIWECIDGKDNQKTIKEMVEAVCTYLPPFAENNNSLEKLCDNMVNSHLGLKHKMAYRIPAAYYILGKVDLAVSYLMDELNDLGTRDDDAANIYRSYANELLKCIGR